MKGGLRARTYETYKVWVMETVHGRGLPKTSALRSVPTGFVHQLAMHGAANLEVILDLGFGSLQ